MPKNQGLGLCRAVDSHNLSGKFGLGLNGWVYSAGLANKVRIKGAHNDARNEGFISRVKECDFTIKRNMRIIGLELLDGLNRLPIMRSTRDNIYLLAFRIDDID